MNAFRSCLAQHVPPPPLLLKELRVRMRARTVVITSNLYILALCTTVLFSVFFIGNLGDALGWEIGRSLYRFLVNAQSLLMLFVAPLVAAAAIAEEREQKTYDTLRVTPAKPGQIVMAKLAAALGCFLMLIMVSLPIASISFILGGVAPADLIVAYAYTLLSTMTAGAMGLYWSARFERSIAAIPAASLCVVLLLVFGPMLAQAGALSLGVISPLAFLEAAFDGTTVAFFGMQCPVWVPSFLILALLFVYFVGAVSVRLRFDRDRRYVLQRLVALVLFVLAMVFTVGEHTASSQPAEARQTMSFVLGLVLAALFAAAPWLGANRSVAESETSASPGAWLRRIVVSGPGFVFLMWLITVPVVLMALRTVGNLKIPVLSVWQVHAGVIAPAALAWAVLGAVLAGRTTARRRFAGLTAAYIVMLAVTLVPLIVAGVVSARSPDNVPVWVQALTLISPVSMIGAIAEPQEMQATLKTLIGVIGKEGPLAIASTLYIVLLLALAFLRRMLAPRETPSGPLSSAD